MSGGSIELGQRPVLSVGIATADPLALGGELDVLDAAGIRVVHVDVMDGVFCPVVSTAGPSLARALRARFVVDVHLMVERPLEQVPVWVAAGAQMVTFHAEATRHSLRVLQSTDPSETVRGVALLPSTPLATLGPLLDHVELVQLLAVSPGWSGQRFLANTLERIREARELIGDRRVLLAVDGGVNREVVPSLVDAGVDVVVCGSAIFDGGDAGRNARDILALMR